jgi:nucleotide-binding universal stress UspA family protein
MRNLPAMAQCFRHCRTRPWGAAAARHPSTQSAAPEKHMYKHILLPTDGSELSKKAVLHGIALAKAIGADVTALVVSTPFASLLVDPSINSAASAEYKTLVSNQATKHLNNVRDKARDAGVSCNSVCLEHDQPYEAIIETAKKRGCDLIIMASHGLRGVSAIVLGSETLKVLTHTSIPVLVYR